MVSTNQLYDRIIPIWLIVYDQDPRRCYAFTDQDKVLRSFEGSARQMFPDCPENEATIQMILDRIKKNWDESFILIPLFNMVTFIHRIDLDRHNNIHRALVHATEALSKYMDDLDVAKALAEILSLFVDPQALAKV